MPQLDEELVINIIDALEGSGDPFYSVSHLAHDLKCVENDSGDCACLTTKFVTHLLHLEDLGCIENMLRETSWGYVPQVEGLVIKHGEAWETPYCYIGDGAESAIRLTANALQLREVLRNQSLTTRVKQTLLSVGGGAVRAVLNEIVLDQLGGK